MVEAHHAIEDLHVEVPTDENYADYLNAALRFGTTPNGVFGAKLFWEHHKEFVRRLALIPEYASLSGVERLWKPFGPDLRVTYLVRNCADAALSLWRAEVTNEWSRPRGATAPPAPDEVDVLRVSRLHAKFHAADIAWPDLIRARGIVPLTITYADVIADLRGTVERIASHAGVEVSPSALPTRARFVRQADEATERFREAWALAGGGCEACGL